MVFELSLTPNKFESWYHDFMTKGASPANEDKSKKVAGSGILIA